MAGTAQQTKAAITLKGSTDIVAEFFRNYSTLLLTIMCYNFLSCKNLVFLLMIEVIRVHLYYRPNVVIFKGEARFTQLQPVLVKKLTWLSI